MKRMLLLICVVALSVPSAAHAGFVGTMTGASAFSGSRDGFVNFAVYTNDGGTGNWITDLGLGGVVTNIPGIVVPPFIPGNPASTGLEKNVFFYQIARTDSADTDPITTMTAPLGDDAWTTMGFLSGTVFTDAGGSVVGSDTSGNNSLDSGGITGFAASGAAVDPVTTLGTLDNGGGGGDFFFTAPALVGGDHSSVTFFTSDSDPLLVASALFVNDPLLPAIFRPGSVTGGLAVTLPTSNPEPGSLILLGLGMMGGGAGVLWKRRKKKTAPESV